MVDPKIALGLASFVTLFFTIGFLVFTDNFLDMYKLPLSTLGWTSQEVWNMKGAMNYWGMANMSTLITSLVALKSAGRAGLANLCCVAGIAWLLNAVHNIFFILPWGKEVGMPQEGPISNIVIFVVIALLNFAGATAAGGWDFNTESKPKGTPPIYWVQWYNVVLGLLFGITFYAFPNYAMEQYSILNGAASFNDTMMMMVRTEGLLLIISALFTLAVIFSHEEGLIYKVTVGSMVYWGAMCVFAAMSVKLTTAVGPPEGVPGQWFNLALGFIGLCFAVVGVNDIDARVSAGIRLKHTKATELVRLEEINEGIDHLHDGA